MRKVAIILLIFLQLYTLSQNTHVAGLFPTIDHSGELTTKLRYNFYYFAALPLINLNKPVLHKDANFLLFYSEQSLTYNITTKLFLTGSYVFQRANAIYDNYVNENRFYVQAKYKHSVQKVNFTHRLRFDGRFIQNRITNETPFTHRVRYLLGLDFPIKSKHNNLYMTMYEEAFFNTVSRANPVYAENWAYAALGIKLNEKNKIEPGILYIRWNTGASNWFNQYYFQLTWISHLDFKK